MEKGNRRVLEMLHSKDVVIDKLQKTLSVQTRALSDQTNRFVLSQLGNSISDQYIFSRIPSNFLFLLPIVEI